MTKHDVEIDRIRSFPTAVALKRDVGAGYYMHLVVFLRKKFGKTHVASAKGFGYDTYEACLVNACANDVKKCLTPVWKSRVSVSRRRF
jgi:hypothetical protein